MQRQIGFVEFVCLMSVLTALTALSIDIMLPALSLIGRDLQAANANDVQLIISLFVFGMVFGEILSGPLSDAYGRKPVILGGLALFCVGALISALAPSLEVLLIGRVIQGIGVAGPKIATRALIRDRFVGDRMAKVMSLVYMLFIAVPMLAPAVGMLLTRSFGWHSMFVMMMLQAIIAGFWLQTRQKETLEKAQRVPLSIPRLMSNGRAIFGHVHVMLYTLMAGLMFSAMLTFLSTVPVLLEDAYGITTWFPLFFAGIAVAIGLASLTNSQLVERYGMRRMVMVSLTGLIFCASLLLLSGERPPLAVLVVLFLCITFFKGFLIGNVNALALEWLGRVAGFGNAVVSSVSSLIAVVVTIPIARSYDGTVMPIAIGYLLAGVGSLAIMMYLRGRVAVPV